MELSATRSPASTLTLKLKGIWASGIKSTTPRISPSKMTIGSVSKLNTLASMMMATLKSITRLRPDIGGLASDSAAMPSVLLRMMTASATSNSSLLFQDGMLSPTTTSLTLIMRTTR